MSSKTYRRPVVVATTVLATGVLASLAGNLQAINLDNQAPGIGAHISAVFWPVILFGTVELLIHTPWMSNWRDRLTKGAVVILVAGVAAWVSYWHLANVLSHYGYDVASRYVGPLAVDAAMVLATLALNRIGHARRAAMAEQRFLDTPTDMSTADLDSFREDMDNLEPVQMDIQPNVADEAQSYLDRLSAELDSGTTAAHPVSPAPTSNVVKLDSISATAREMIWAWDSADESERPTPGQVDALVAASQGVTSRTARRWRTTLLSGVDLSGA